jgi:ketosteroid isomerase-like protein
MACWLEMFDSVKHRAERTTVYHTIVKRIVTKNFERVKDCAADIHHRFGGHHALGGERHDREALGRWFERLGRLFPMLKLTVRDVWVKGWPHNTTVIIRWIGTQILPDGAPYENHGVHIVRMRWGKVVDIDANEDSQLVAESLKTCAFHGIQEALAEPIVS